MDPRGLILVALVVAVAVSMRMVLAARRRREVAAVAARMGLEPTALDPGATFPFAFFAKGDSRGADNVFAGPVDDARAVLFDYWYEEVTTDADGDTRRERHRFTCAVTRVDAACSSMSIERENVLTRMASAVGFRDIEVESDEFNRRFRVRCSDTRFAYAFCDAGMIEHLLRIPSTYEIEVLGPWLMVRSSPVRPADWWTLLGVLRDTRRRLPASVPRLYPLQGVA